jgi:hypothetical protein
MRHLEFCMRDLEQSSERIGKKYEEIGTEL